MKKLLVLIIVLAIISGAAFAADNQSASYVRMLARETATDSIDTAYFNPAGTAFLEKGFHVQLNNQFVWLDYEHTSAFSGTTYESKNFIPLFPSGYAGYAGDGWAAFFSYTIPDGGGSLDFEDGIYAFESSLLNGISTLTGSLEASSATHMFSVGGSYLIGDFLSVSLVGNLSMAITKTNVNILTSPDVAGALNGTAEVTQSGIGFGGTFGIHYRPIDSVNLAVTVESGQKISQDVKDTSSSNTNTETFLEGYVTSQFTDADRPWRMRFGASYTFPFGLEIPASFKYDFYKSMDSSLRNSYAIALALRYPITDAIEVSIGSSYDIDEVPDVDDYNPLNPELSSVTIAGGVGWEIFENFKLDVGALYPFYFAEEASGALGFTKLDKQVFTLAVGVGYIF